MTLRVVLEPEARADLATAFEWYEGQLDGLGYELLASAEATLTLIEQSPEVFQIVYKQVRKAPLRRFPFAILYVTKKEHTAHVIAVFHARKDPDGWKERISKFLSDKS